MSTTIPFVKIMKPSKVDSRKVSHVKKLEEIKHSSNYTIEEKLDGVHIVMYGDRAFSIKESKVTGCPIEKTEAIPQIVSLFKKYPLLIVEGECYLPGKKVPAVVSIINSDPQKALAKQITGNVLHFKVFDIIRDIDGTWMTDCTWEERSARLAMIYVELQVDNYHPYVDLNIVSNCTEVNVEEYIYNILSKDGEGVVFKNKKDKYYPGKRPMWNWVKVKAAIDDIDVFITGYESATRLYTGDNLEGWKYWEHGEAVTKSYYLGLVGSIKIGMYDDKGNIVDKGRVSGMTDAVRLELSTNGDRYLNEVIKIKAMEKTEDGKFRHGSFVDFHPDKNAKDCIDE